MNSILVSYIAYDSPRTEYFSVDKSDLMGNATVCELIAGLRGFAPDAIRIVDLIPQ